ncbi:DUF2750 domain-containing protein [Inquilinus sp. KBS0705]|nr:DUF2750 domain-containing protein [Inquilinus sp. KBS0705]
MEEQDLKYRQFIEKVAASKLVWGLKSKTGWANTESAEDEEVALIPFWSDRTLAKLSAREDWKNYTPTEVPLAIFLEDWCMEMAENETLAGINLNPRMDGIEVDAISLALDILNQLKAINSAITFENYSSINEFITEISESVE